MFWTFLKILCTSNFRLFGIHIRSRYSTITDDDLDTKVEQLTEDNQFLGQRHSQGMLEAEGVHVQGQREADSFIRVNEAGVAMRWCRAGVSTKCLALMRYGI